MSYLLDTNVVAELTVRPKPEPSVVAWARSLAANDFFLSSMTMAEIQFGVDCAPNPQRKALYATVLSELRAEYEGRIIAIGEPEAAAFLAIHKRLKAEGNGIDPPDALIAATAMANGWTVATRNIKHLERTGASLVNPWDYDGQR